MVIEMLNGPFELKWDRKDILNIYNDTVVSNTDTTLFIPEHTNDTAVVSRTSGSVHCCDQLGLLLLTMLNLRQLLSFKTSVQTRALGYLC